MELIYAIIQILYNPAENVKWSISMNKEYNKQLVKKYPFLLPRNRWTGKVPKEYDYSYTELDDMPDGWRKAFGEQMCEEIKQ